MKSAYSVLGVPGNADREDIDIAYKVALTAFTKERMVDRPELAEKLSEVREAYKVLSSAELRAAHDRKLAQLVAPAIRRATPVVEHRPEGSGTLGFLVIGALLLACLFGAGAYISNERSLAKQAQIAREAKERERADKEAKEALAAQQQEQEKLAAEKYRKDRDAEVADRRFRLESQRMAADASYNVRRVEAQQAQALAAERANAQRAEAESRNEERRRAYEAQARVEADKRRIRELCYINYKRYDC